MKPGKLKEFRNKKKYTQAQLADKLGMNRSLLAQIEREKAKLPEKYIEKLCLILNIKIEDLFESKKEESNEIDDELLEISIDIIDSIIDASDISQEERLNLLYNVYHLVEEVSVKNISNEELEKEVEEIKARIKEEAELKKAKKDKRSLLKSLFKKNIK